jgi:LPXTG-site transpeptidase (sortase) family protein
MSKLQPILSRVLLALGGLMILTGVGWFLWLRVQVPPDPALTAEGAVVLAVTAPPRSSPVDQSASEMLPTSTETPANPDGSSKIDRSGIELTPTLAAAGPTPDLLPEVPALDTPPPPTPPVGTVDLLAEASPPRADKPPTQIVAPAIKLDAKVTSMGWEIIDRKGTFVSEWVIPKNAAGWHINSALPGQGENVVLSGHHNIDGKVFRYVVDLTLGDEISLYVEEDRYVYVVTEKYILKEAGMPAQVRRQNAQWIMPTGDERLTLVTCWPYEWPGNTHRVIVVARPPDWDLSKEQKPH